MSYLKSLERNYVMGDIQLFNEFDNSHFISNAKTAITGNPEPTNVNMDFNYYADMIEKAIRDFNVIKLDKDTIKDFLMKFDSLQKLDASNIIVRDITTSDVGAFKPQYISQFVSMVQIAIDKAIRGEITQEEVIRYVSGEIPEKVERQVVKTSLAYGVNSKDLIKMDNTKMVKADTAYVKGKLIPFVTKYDQIKNDTITEANSVLNAVRETESTVKAMLSAVDKIKMSNRLDKYKIQMLNLISFNAMRSIIEIISYVSFMLIRKINTVGSNIISCNKLYIEISDLYSDLSTESAFDQNILPTDINSLAENLIEGRSDAYTTLADEIYRFNTVLPDINDLDEPHNDNIINNEIDQEEYDKTIYENIIKAYMEISVGLDVLSLEDEDYILVFDDIIDKSGFSAVLEERFQNEIRVITDVSNRQSDIRRLLAEIKDYGNNMEHVANIIMETYKKLKFLQKRYEDNNNNEYTDLETINEIKIFLNSLDEQYVNLTKKIAEAFYTRIKALGLDLSSLKKKDNVECDCPIIESEIDFNDLSFDSIADEYTESCKDYFNALQRSYFYERAHVLRGVNVVYEADESTPDTSTNTNTNNNQQQQQSTGNTQPQNNTAKNNTTVSVQDNSADSSKQSSIGKLASKVSKFIKTTVDKFMEFVGKSSSRNAKWLANNKQGLMNRSYNNVTVNILPYNNIPPNQITTDIEKLKTNVNSLTPQIMQGFNKKDDLYAKIFAFVDGGIKEANGSLSDQITKYYKVGTEPLNVVPISNGQLKSEVSTVMIPFCENYVNSYKSELERALNDVGKAVDNTVAKFNTVSTTESVSIFTEANEPNKNTQENMNEKVSWLSEAVKYFTGSILNAVKDRNADYLKALNNLTLKNANNNQNNNNNTNNNTNNQ